MNNDAAPESLSAIPTPALWLGLGGLLPFFAGAAASFAPVPDVAAVAQQALAVYAAVILSFLGGVRWGAALRDERALAHWTPLTLSVLPSLVAWVALLLPPDAMLALLLVGLIGQFLLDARAARAAALPTWYARLRTILTAGAGSAVAAGLVATLG